MWLYLTPVIKSPDTYGVQHVPLSTVPCSLYFLTAKTNNNTLSNTFLMFLHHLAMHQMRFVQYLAEEYTEPGIVSNICHQWMILLRRYR
jgi:hypothetical protein